MAATIGVCVELFGTARMACGARRLNLRLRNGADISDMVAAAAAACPELVGVALRDDLAGLLESYTLNLNGVEFVSEQRLRLADGDRVLLFSSQAGG